MITMSEWLFTILMLALGFCAVVGWPVLVFSTIGLMFDGYLVLFKTNVIWHQQWRKHVRRMCIGLIAVSPFWFIETITANKAIVSGDRQDGYKVVKAFSRDTIMWQSQWNKFVLTAGAEFHIANFSARTVGIMMGFHPITENPKVRSLKYNIGVRTGETPEDLAALEGAFGPVLTEWHQSSEVVPGWIREKVKYLLYEFNEKNSKQLALLYNPLDKLQQTTFQTMLQNSLAGPLKECGIYVAWSQFDIGD